MMKHILQRVIFSVLGLFLLASCDKVDELSNDTSVVSVSVTSAASVEHPDATIITGTTVIKGNTIEVPLLTGKYSVPIVLTLDIETSGAVQVLNLEDGNKLTFDNLLHERKFYTVAASGQTTEWTVAFTDASTNESAEVLRAEIVSTSGGETLITGKYGTLNPFEKFIAIPAITDVTYPLTVDVKFVISDDSRIISDIEPNEDDSYTCVFNTEEDVVSIEVESQTGKIKKWDVKISQVDTDLDDISDDDEKRLSIEASKITVDDNAPIKILRVLSTFAKGIITITAETKQRTALTYPLSIKLNIPISETQALIGAPKDGIYTFDNNKDQSSIVYIQDEISGLIKGWHIIVSPEHNIDITDFRDVSIVSSGITGLSVDESGIIFDKNALKIVIPVSSANGEAINPNQEINLRLNYAYTDPQGVGKSVTNKLFETINSNVIIYVTSDLGDVYQQWTVYLRDVNAEKKSITTVNKFSANLYYTPKDLLYLTSTVDIDANTKTVTIEIKRFIADLPLTLLMYNIKLEDGMSNVKEPQFTSEKAPIVFESLSSEHSFTVVAEDGITEEKWTIKLSDDSDPLGTTADLEDFIFKGMSTGVAPTSIDINQTDKVVLFEVSGDEFPMYLQAKIETSDNSSVSGINNNTLFFSKIDDVNTFVITSEDGSVSNEWEVKLKKSGKVQIANSDFEKWGKFLDVNGGTATLDPISGVGFGWATANLMIGGMGVEGAKPVGNLGGFAAEMTTSEQNAMFYGEIMAAGTVYTGKFDGSRPFDYITTPWMMTNFGIPFSSRPSSFNVDVKYNAGAQLKKATLVGNKFTIASIEGVDEAHIWIKLLHWSKSEPLKFHGYNYQVDGVTILGETELVINGSNKSYNAWQNINMQMNYNPSHSALNPTHLVVVMASSKKGDLFIGATGSKLTVDNFVINY